MPAPSMLPARAALREHFGHDAFRPGQEAIVASVLSGRDTVAIMPTGGGKSLCYQLPAMLNEGVTLVVSPLIALMKDQVDALAARGLPATFLNSSLDPDEFEHRLAGLRSGAYRLVYVAPERFRHRAFLEAMRDVPLALLAIDEAHCVSQWGHDFRPDYMKLGEARARLGSPPVLAATATATPEVRDDLIAQLRLQAPAVFVHGFDRPNLRLVVRPASGEQGKLGKMLEVIQKVAGPAVIYTATRKHAEHVHAHLLEAGERAALYHAGLDEEERSSAQEAWQAGRSRIIVATNAFGMGVDKPDVRLVMHYDLPGTLEAYYQEAGRAGRDGKRSYCVLLYSPADRYLQQFFIEGASPSVATLEAVYRVLCAHGDRVILTHEALAEELPGKVHPMAISTCLNVLERHGVIARAPRGVHQAYVKHALALMPIDSRAKQQKAVYRALREHLGDELERGALFDVAALAQSLGEKRETVTSALVGLAERGLIRYTPPQRGRAIEILRREADFGALGLDVAYLDGKHGRELEKLEKMIGWATTPGCRRAYMLDHFGERAPARCGNCDRCLEAVPMKSPAPVGPGLREALGAWRQEAARAEGLPAYCILHDRVLDQLASERPGTLEALAALPGLGPDKAHRHGPALLSLLGGHLVGSGTAS